jgi:GT2 family glycosyltransferase
MKSAIVMSEAPRVSVVIAVPESAGDLERTLQSVLASDLSAIEVITVQSGPVGSSAVRAAEINDPRVIAVRLRPGYGSLRARNVGVARASAPYVALLEVGDTVTPETLSSAANALDRTPDVGLAFCACEYPEKDGATLRSMGVGAVSRLEADASSALEGGWRRLPPESFARALLYENFVATSGLVVRRQLLHEVGPLDETLPAGAELDLWFRLAHRSAALYRNEVGVYAPRRSHASAGDTTRAPTDWITALRRERDRWEERAARRLLDRRIARSLADLGYQERLGRRRLRSSATFAYAFATSGELRWLGALLRSIVA